MRARITTPRVTRCSPKRSNCEMNQAAGADELKPPERTRIVKSPSVREEVDRNSVANPSKFASQNLPGMPPSRDLLVALDGYFYRESCSDYYHQPRDRIFLTLTSDSNVLTCPA